MLELRRRPRTRFENLPEREVYIPPHELPADPGESKIDFPRQEAKIFASVSCRAVSSLPPLLFSPEYFRDICSYDCILNNRLSLTVPVVEATRERIPLSSTVQLLLCPKGNMSLSPSKSRD